MQMINKYAALIRQYDCVRMATVMDQVVEYGVPHFGADPRRFLVAR